MPYHPTFPPAPSQPPLSSSTLVYSPMQAQEQALLSWLAKNGKPGDSSPTGTLTVMTLLGPNQLPLNSLPEQLWQNMVTSIPTNYTATTGWSSRDGQEDAHA